MSIDERNAVTEEFRTKTDVFVSTDAGGEGLNLQFASVVINYDMPWNPMRIEQRCGRVDRIGQTRDVEVYNFMIDDTVESRVHEVIEEKLSVILDELGIDKYSDVLAQRGVRPGLHERLHGQHRQTTSRGEVRWAHREGAARAGVQRCLIPGDNPRGQGPWRSRGR